MTSINLVKVRNMSNSCYAVKNETAGKAGVPPASEDLYKKLQAGRLLYP